MKSASPSGRDATARPRGMRIAAISAAIPGCAIAAPALAFHAASQSHVPLVAALAATAFVATLLGALAWRIHRLNIRLREKHARLEHATRDLARSEGLHRLLTENSGDVIWMLDLTAMRLEYVSPSVQRLRGYTPEEVIAQPWTAWMTQASTERMRTLLRERTQRIVDGDASAQHAIDEFDMPHKQGGTVPTEIVSTFLMDETGKPVKVLGVTRAITARKSLEAELRTRLAAVEVAGDAVVITDRRGVILYANAASQLHTGYTAEELRGRHTRIFSSGRQSGEFYEGLWRDLYAGRVWRGELVNRRKDGSLYDEEMTIAPVKNERGEIEYFVAIKRDVSEQHRIERALHEANQQLSAKIEEISMLHRLLAEQALRDPLTGLHNRRYLEERLPEVFARARREGEPVTVALVDIDHFKRINDTYGHAGGDEVIRALATLLQASVREYDITCRYGGEEFLLVLPSTAPDVAHARLETLREDFAAQPVRHGRLHIAATLSIGLAAYPEHASRPDALIEQADTALYLAKRTGRNRVESATPATPTPA
jgi:diguanylate cyclase (GGDEF)-like protein/PAS domain S-box-containing protein